MQPRKVLLVEAERVKHLEGNIALMRDSTGVEEHGT
jgi:hypothetical protein